MLIDADNGCHLSYCSNIHPGEAWSEVHQTLDSAVPAVKARLGWEGAFGVGLRLAARAADDLADAAAFEALTETLDRHGLYVFTINGFPYGPFHGTRVKEEVYLPDWRDPERVRYSNRLADLFDGLLEHAGLEFGSISTVPGAFKARVTSDADRDAIVQRLMEHAAHLVELERRSGRCIALALEPEPCCYLETIEETVRFFDEALFRAESLASFGQMIGTSAYAAEQALRRHLGVCLDLCHAAVEFEDPNACVDALDASGIAVHKMQVSAGLRFQSVDRRTLEMLEPFNDAVYLHQVIARSDEGIERFVDLPEAFESVERMRSPTEWRVHFHVPIFLGAMGEFESTQPFIEAVLERHRNKPISSHIEVETYTWDVLPQAYRAMPIVEAVARELDWTRVRSLAQTSSEPSSEPG